MEYTGTNVMSHDEFVDLAKSYANESLDILVNTKGRDYAPNGMVLEAVDQLACDLNIDSSQVLYVFLAKHLTALKKFIMSGKVDSEGINSRMVDIVNYVWLIRANAERKKKED